MNTHTKEVEQGDRFKFGKNWQAFISVLDESRILEAEKSLKNNLELESLAGMSFLDIGSGSGLFSLAARRLGATVHSLDFDPQSVACTQHLKDNYFNNDDTWSIEQGSILDEAYIKNLGKFDIVYSWGVLHHTGSMWQALDNAILPVTEGGSLFIAIYNHQQYGTPCNTLMKRSYNKASKIGKIVIASTFISIQVALGLVKDIISHGNPAHRYIEKRKSRGMSMYYDWIDWIGGYPFEAAKPEEIFERCQNNGFNLEKLHTTGGYGCNEYVFKKTEIKGITNVTI